MKLEKQVCSLELAKELKKLGVKQESLWYWKDFNGKHTMESDLELVDYNLRDSNMFSFHSAFTVAELGELLPSHFISWKVQKNYYISEQLQSVKDRINKTIFSTVEVNARAKMLIYLIKEGLVNNG